MSIFHLFKDVLLAPSRGLACAARRGSFAPPLVAATLSALLFAVALVPRVDHERAVQERLDRSPEGAQVSPNDRQVAVAQAEKLGALVAYGEALFGPALRALAVASSLVVAFRVAGARPRFHGMLSAASWGLLPLALQDALSLPALLRVQGIAPEDSARVLPSSLASLLPCDLHGLARAAQGVDLFSLWSVALVALGAAHVAGVSRRRASAVVLVLWGSYVLLSYVARPAFMGQPGQPG